MDKRRVTQTLQALTTVLFRCPGLKASAGHQDAFGMRDVFAWSVFLLLVAAWYQVLFLPTREQNTQLSQRLEQRQRDEHKAQIRLARIRQETTALRNNQKDAWERAARVQLGWLAPGEALDPQTWCREHPRWQAGVSGSQRVAQQHQAELNALLRVPVPSRRQTFHRTPALPYRTMPPPSAPPQVASAPGRE